jgi:hypothetical protein
VYGSDDVKINDLTLWKSIFGVIVLPVAIGVAGGLFGAVNAGFYNAAANICGGIEIEVHQGKPRDLSVL